MVWDIYSIGDGAYLSAVLNAVAAVTGTGQFAKAAALGLLIGMLIVAFQGVVSGGQSIKFQNLFIGWVLYMVIFVPKATVAITDVYTAQVRVVANVPLGVAFTGSVVSTVGHTLTDLFETAFSTPAMESRGFAASLHTLRDVRLATLSALAHSNANEAVPGADLEKTMTNYIADCTLAGVDINRYTIGSVYDGSHAGAGADPMQAIKFDSPTYTTEYFLGGAPRLDTCTNSWNAIDNYINTKFTPEMYKTLQATMQLGSTAEAQSRIDEALSTLGMAGVAAQQFMLASAMIPWLNNGIEQTHLNYRQFSLATQTAQAMRQRDSQWMSESSLFQSIVHPMMTFFEAFVYAVTPIMAFAIVLGPFGITLVGKYLLMAFWVQLWMPVLAIVNLYIQLAASGQMDALQHTAGALPAVPALDAVAQLDFVISHWLGTGSMLAASVPAISLMLVYGSAITATSLLGRIQGGDFVNERISAPDVASSAPAMAINSLQTADRTFGTAAPNAAQILGSFDISHTRGQAISSASEAVHSRSERFTDQLSNVAERSVQTSKGASIESTLGRNFSGSTSSTDRFLARQGQSFANRFSTSGINQDQFSSLLAGKLDGSIGSERLSGELSGMLQSRFNIGEDQSKEIANAIENTVGRDQGFQSELARSVSQDTRTGERSVFTEGLSEADRSSLGQSADEVVSANDTFSTVSREENAVKFGGSFSALAVGRMAVENPEVGSRIDAVMRQHGLVGEQARLASQLSVGAHIGDPRQSSAIAGLRLMLGDAKPSLRAKAEITHADDPGARAEKEQAELNRKGFQIIGALTGMEVPNTGDAGANRGAGNGVPASRSVEEAVQGHGHDPRPDTGGIRGRVDAERAAAADTVSTPRKVIETFTDGRDAGSVAGANQSRALNEKIAQTRGSEIHEMASKPASLAKKVLDEIGGGMARVKMSGSTTADGLGASVATAKAAFDAARADGKGIGESIMAGAKAAPDGMKAVFSDLVDKKVAEIAPLNLSPEQINLFREETKTAFGSALAKDLGVAAAAAMGASVAGPLAAAAVGLGTATIENLLQSDSQDLANAKAKLVASEPAGMGEDQATLIHNAAFGGRGTQDSGLQRIAEFEQAAKASK